MIVADGLRRVEAVEINELPPARRIHEIRSGTFVHVEDQLEAIHKDVLFERGENFRGDNAIEFIQERRFVFLKF